MAIGGLGHVATGSARFLRVTSTCSVGVADGVRCKGMTKLRVLRWERMAGGSDGGGMQLAIGERCMRARLRGLGSGFLLAGSPHAGGRADSWPADSRLLMCGSADCGAEHMANRAGAEKGGYAYGSAYAVSLSDE